MNRKLLSVCMATLMVASVAVPALAADDLGVSVAQSGNQSTVTVTVTDNGTAVENATVDVTVLETLEETNATVSIGGRYETGTDGTVTFGAPAAEVRVDVTATVGNASATTTTVLEPAANGTDAFGLRVSAFVTSLLSSGGTGPGFGQAVAEFVTEHNPGASERPEHAGPPGDVGNESADGNETDGERRRGPPEHAGPGPDTGDDADGNETDGDGLSTDEAGGPPERAGPPS